MTDLKACPACGKKQGEVAENLGARFPFAVQCRACGWSTEYVKLRGVAEKLWNDAKKPR
jgi:hypothetical protein